MVVFCYAQIFGNAEFVCVVCDATRRVGGQLNSTSKEPGVRSFGILSAQTNARQVLVFALHVTIVFNVTIVLVEAQRTASGENFTSIFVSNKLKTDVNTYVSIPPSSLSSSLFASVPKAKKKLKGADVGEAEASGKPAAITGRNSRPKERS